MSEHYRGSFCLTQVGAGSEQDRQDVVRLADGPSHIVGERALRPVRQTFPHVLAMSAGAWSGLAAFQAAVNAAPPLLPVPVPGLGSPRSPRSARSTSTGVGSKTGTLNGSQNNPGQRALSPDGIRQLALGHEGVVPRAVDPAWLSRSVTSEGVRRLARGVASPRTSSSPRSSPPSSRTGDSSGARLQAQWQEAVGHEWKEAYLLHNCRAERGWQARNQGDLSPSPRLYPGPKGLGAYSRRWPNRVAEKVDPTLVQHEWPWVSTSSSIHGHRCESSLAPTLWRPRTASLIKSELRQPLDTLFQNLHEEAIDREDRWKERRALQDEAIEGQCHKVSDSDLRKPPEELAEHLMNWGRKRDKRRIELRKEAEDLEVEDLAPPKICAVSKTLNIKKIWERTDDIIKRREQHLKEGIKAKAEDELDGCTFHPDLTGMAKGLERGDMFEEQKAWRGKIEENYEAERKRKHLEETKGCTFHPEVTSSRPAPTMPVHTRLHKDAMRRQGDPKWKEIGVANDSDESSASEFDEGDFEEDEEEDNSRQRTLRLDSNGNPLPPLPAPPSSRRGGRWNDDVPAMEISERKQTGSGRRRTRTSRHSLTQKSTAPKRGDSVFEELITSIQDMTTPWHWALGSQVVASEVMEKYTGLSGSFEVVVEALPVPDDDDSESESVDGGGGSKEVRRRPTDKAASAAAVRSTKGRGRGIFRPAPRRPSPLGRQPPHQKPGERGAARALPGKKALEASKGLYRNLRNSVRGISSQQPSSGRRSARKVPQDTE